ncbi:cell wall metabolism sensor histidine kinase WalK [[Phormidium] sp. ETS-05]|uniref:sensor histidine kinase n=1 Tax=[Phormidium] sp. ETS-05 TaxID=222819 RepID=UPI001E298C1A|nr:HAMP domain-containing sensor histidine kinase [[Phormidium] sp. ETS-05]
MAWGIGSTKTSNPQFRALHWRLLLSYLGVMVAILGTATVTVYEFFAQSLYQQFDIQLMTLAQAAAHSLGAIKYKYDHHHDEEEEDDEGDEKDDDEEREIPKNPRQILPRLDGDGDLDIPWQNLRQPQQGVEWFNESEKLLAKEGTRFPNANLVPTSQLAGKTRREEELRSLTLPVFSGEFDEEKDQRELAGYVRISQSTVNLDLELNRLCWGLGMGGTIALALTGMGGMWLTRQALEPIENSFEQLKQFTADASHELRSPLTAIKTSISVMQSHPERIHPADVKKVAAIASATNQMTHLVEDLLLLARMEGAIANIHEFSPIPLADILEDVIECALPQAESKQITLTSHIISGTVVMGNAPQLARLFTNLLANAIQYTPDGGKVTLSSQRIANAAIVNVEDTGIGIAPEDLPYVFDRFWRADKARNRRQGGLGMGLAIAQTIAQSHQGQITVTSQLGIGTCFRVRLPLL